MAAIRENRPDYLKRWAEQLENSATRDLASRLINDYEQLSDPASFMAALDQAVGEERAEMLAILFRSSGMVDSTVIEQWMMENPLTPEDERLLQQLDISMITGFGDQC